jgi:nitrous oxidase accessory protein
LVSVDSIVREENLLIKRYLVIGIILLFFLISFNPSFAFDNIKKSSKLLVSSGNILYVGGSGPGNYTRIQDAINNASEGDTVFVYDDSSPYFENLVINKSIVVLGEEKNSTVVDGGKNNNVVSISADNVIIDGFTIQHSDDWSGHHGFLINASDNVTISDNNIVENFEGIALKYTSNCAIKNNTFIRNEEVSNQIFFCNNTLISDNTIIESENGLIGILLETSTFNFISRNTIEHHQLGIKLISSDNNTIIDNILKNNDNAGIKIAGGANNLIFNNIIQSNDSNYYFGITIGAATDKMTIQNNIIDGKIYGDSFGIYLGGVHSKDFIIEHNTFSNNAYGILLFDSSLITISNNNFIKNDCDAFFKLLPFEKNLWKGNYWDDHPGRGPKPIGGRVLLFSIEFPALYLYFEFRIHWVNFDWHPAQEPYDI